MKGAMPMISTNGIVSNASNYYESNIKKPDKAKDAKSVEKATDKDKVTGGLLSKEASEYLSNLKKKYADYDIFVQEDKDNSQPTKEFSVYFSAEELEKMAKDEGYAKDKLNAMETAVRMSKKINEMFGAGEDGFNSEGVSLESISVTVDDNGVSKFFAEMRKVNEQQFERIKKAREKKAKEEKAKEAKEEKAEKEAKMAEKNENVEYTVKTARIEAFSEEEFLDKISKIDWNNIPDELVRPGNEMDLTV
ncbi:DUF6033 family protein [Eubacterium xylanophilum]|uniref:DUF6033 family protein n=1 Tax=Eubacterium xylanophilum TaxID=39497 RepID=UPI00047E86C1|nr:DUF6033 family protein [Eubacterium xylanophilum]